MVGERDIVAISIPFVSGVAFAALVPWDGSLYAAAGVACGAVAALLALLSRRRAKYERLPGPTGARRPGKFAKIFCGHWPERISGLGRNFQPGRGWSDLAVAIALYFILGAWCWLTASLRCGGGVPPEAPHFDFPLGERALEGLQSLIDRCFGYGGAGGGGLPGAEGGCKLPGAGAAAMEHSRSLGSRAAGGGDAAALLKALLTGQRKGLAPEAVAAFRTSGAAHILALSGLHLGVIYGILTRGLALLGRSRPAMLLRSLLAVAACGFYCLMCGAGPSLVRAFLFICINEFARHSPGRRREPLRVLCAALMIQLVACPGVIASVGFQLSYLSMAGIFILFPRLDAWYPALSGLLKGHGSSPSPEPSNLSKGHGSGSGPVLSGLWRSHENGSNAEFSTADPDDQDSCQTEKACISKPGWRSAGAEKASRFDLMRKVWSSAALSISCQFLTAPVVWMHFHTFPKYFLITNLLALPLTEALIISAVLTLLLSAFGLQPTVLIRLVDFLSRVLLSTLHIISSLD